MGWEYRIIKHDTGGQSYYAVHEVFYDKSSKIEGWTAEPVVDVGDNKKEIIDALNMVLQDCKKPILIESRLIESVQKK